MEVVVVVVVLVVDVVAVQWVVPVDDSLCAVVGAATCSFWYYL